jgi:biotin/methionine sulfoxide reductase
MGKISRIPHCSHWGAYTVLVSNNEIVGVEPFEHDPAPSPIIHSIKEWTSHKRRVLRPIVRSGWIEKRERSDRSARGREKFVPVSWDDALGLVASEIDRVRKTLGNASIFAGSYGWTSCGRLHHAPTLLKRMLNLVGGFTGHVDTYSIAAGPVILRHTLGSDAACSGQANTLDSIAEHTETLLVFGALSPRTQQIEAGGIGGHKLETYLKRIAERNIRVILISPLRDDLPSWVNAEWWPIRPNTDTALMIGLAGEIVKADRHDKDFLERYCSGSEIFLDYLTGKTDGQWKDAAWAASITELDRHKIEALARKMVSRRSMISVSWGLQRAHHGEQPFWAALGLAAVIGQIGLPGGGVGYGYSSLGGVGAPFGLAKSPGISSGSNPIDSFIPVARISDLLLNPGKRYSYQGQVRTYPDTRLVYWAGGNPFHHHQDLNRLMQGWARAETIIVQDPMFTATAQRADIVLPASTSLERNDLAGNKRCDFILAMRKAIEPLGEARSDFDIFNGIAEKLGVDQDFNEGRAEMEWISYLYEISRTDAKERFAFAMPDFDTFWEQGYARVPVQERYTYLADFRADPEMHALATESGRIVLGSETLAKLNYSDCLHYPAWIEPAEWLGGRSVENQMHLISHQPVGRLHSQLETARSSRAMKKNGREQARLNSADARRLGISHGQTIRLSNSRGQCLATADVTDTVRQGVVVLPTGAWLTPTGNSGIDISGNPNILTLDIPSSQFGQGCSAHTCIVNVEPFAGEAADAISEHQKDIENLVVF